MSSLRVASTARSPVVGGASSGSRQASPRRFAEDFPDVTPLSDPGEVFADHTLVIYSTNALAPHVGAETFAASAV